MIKIKKEEIIKHKIGTSTQKELLNLFNNLFDTILTDNENNKNDNDNENSNENDSENDNDNNNENENDNNNTNNNGNNNNENDYRIKNLNNHLDKMIDKSKSFEDQIKFI